MDLLFRDSHIALKALNHRIDQLLAAGLRLFPINVTGKAVVLKPNLVDYIPGNAINTHPLLVLAAAESVPPSWARNPC